MHLWPGSIQQATFSGWRSSTAPAVLCGAPSVGRDRKVAWNLVGGAPRCTPCSSASILKPAVVQRAVRSRRTTTRVSSSAGADYTPYPWLDSDFRRVEFMPPPYGPIMISKDQNSGVVNGVLCFRTSIGEEQGASRESDNDLKTLEVFVSGDTAVSIYTLVADQPSHRPMVLDLLSQVLQRGQHISKRDWKLLKVAIVDLQHDIYIGRLFFGDPDTGETMWDCDCRPSDACWLALKTKAPVFIHQKVWLQAAMPFSTTHAYRMIQSASKMYQGDAGAASGSSVPTASGTAAADRLERLDAIQLLKRKLELAIKEEDYQSCAQIRDHPWMRKYNEIQLVRAVGYPDQALQLMAELEQMIEGNGR